MDFPGAGVTTSRFSSPGEDIPSTKFLAINPAKNFASAPGQLPRDVVTDAPSERSTAGRKRKSIACAMTTGISELCSASMTD
ncbi:hypothetical protein EB668_13010 [Escherichia coli]|nr:hypothetical protein [Escherichia coli]EFE8030694.1 hypothetical protein [Escherichia coli]EFI3697442.1 hypothetical protein [Escherichia coli]EFN8306566.1 hypothetical protein [Escherichia coli]